MTETPRTVLLTGASGKLGRPMTAALLDAGYRVVGTARREETAAALAAAHAAAVAGGKLHVLPVDLTEAGAIAGIIAGLSAIGGPIHGLVNNARSLDFLRLPEDGRVRREAFLGELLLDAVIPYELTMALLERPEGALDSVVNVASMYGVVAPNQGLYDDPARQSPLHYGTAKAAQIHLTRELAVRLAGRGVRVNAISYGGVEGRVPADFLERYRSLCPQGRMLREGEVAGPLLFLLSAAASAVTGHNLVADGGWTAW